MATIFMKWPGRKGSATAKGTDADYSNGDWIDLSACSFNVERTIKAGVGMATNREAAHPVISEVTLAQTADYSTPLLFSESVTGQPNTGKAAALVEIHMCSPQDDGKMRPWAILKLTNCIISSYKLAGEAEGQPKVDMAVKWTKIDLRFKVMDETNKKVVAQPGFAYDLATNMSEKFG
jgi:type VI protein secretion system component Hcp